MLPMNGQIACAFSFFEDIEKGFRNKRGRKKCFFAPKTDAKMVAFGVPKIEIVPIFSQSSSLLALRMLYIV